MIPRYEHPGIAAIWTDEAKLARWDKVEIAVIDARLTLGLIDVDDAATVCDFVERSPVNVPAWHEREKATGHDLAAYVELRWEGLPAELRRHFHDGMTSYDVEDPAFVLALQQSSGVVEKALKELLGDMLHIVARYRHQPMLDRSHGQWAKLASFGNRVLTWYTELYETHAALLEAKNACYRSRISGAIGTYGGRLSPQIEHEALKQLGLAPFYGTGQIAPRTLYARIAQAEELVAKALAKIAIDFQLGARSGRPLWHEPFSRTQKGSSAMPHKKNPITMEQTEGLACVASGYASMIVESAKTKERRDIAQSCVERIAWPDLFHTLMRMIGNVRRVLNGMMVYPDNMYLEIAESRGTYASDEAKAFLTEELAKHNIGAEVVYRIIQVACWNALSQGPAVATWGLTDYLPPSLFSAQQSLEQTYRPELRSSRGIGDSIANGALTEVKDLDVNADTVEFWNRRLREVFRDSTVHARWKELFSIPFLLAGEAKIFEHFIGD